MPARGVSALTHDDTTSYTPPPAFGPFRVLHQIGIGVLGPVFRTYEPGRDRLVSVKVFRLDLLPEQAATLAEELQGLVEIDLDDPSIVKPLAAGLEGHTVYLAEEYVAAESLDVALKHYAPAPLERALPFLGQLAGAIDFARARGVGHGALHPRDIFLTPELARATGFGIVQAIERLGTRAPVRRPYSAPERIAAAAWSTPADVFALAAVAHELLTGRRPAGAGEVAAIAGKAAESNPELLRGVLARALAEDPAARYSTAHAFVAALEAAAHGRADEPAAAPAWTKPADEPPPAASRELAVELDQDAAQIADAGDVDLRAPEEEATYDLGRIETVQPEPPPEPERPVEPVEPLEVIEEPRAPKRRARPRARPEDVVTEEPSLFDVGATAAAMPEEESPREFDAEPAPAEPGDVIQAPEDEQSEEPPTGIARPPLSTAEADRSRPAILPYAIVAMVALLIGFLAGYLYGSRDRVPPPAEASRQAEPAPVLPAPSAPPATPASPAQQAWSESRVEPPPARVEASPPSPPRAAAPAAPAPTKKPAPPPRAAPSRPPPAPAATMGTLVADSRPPGARVVLDGKAVGKTPLKLANVKPGAHTVRLELDGYRVWVSEITVTGGRDTRVAGSLERMRK